MSAASSNVFVLSRVRGNDQEIVALYTNLDQLNAGLKDIVKVTYRDGRIRMEPSPETLQVYSFAVNTPLSLDIVPPPFENPLNIVKWDTWISAGGSFYGIGLDINDRPMICGCGAEILRNPNGEIIDKCKHVNGYIAKMAGKRLPANF